MTWPRKYDKIPPDDLRAWIAAGMNLNQMAEQAGTYGCVIRRAIQYHGVAYVPHHRCQSAKVTLLDPAEVRRLYWDDMLTQAQIGARTGCSSATITAFMQAHSIPARHCGRYYQPQPWHSRAWLAARMAEHTYAEIAAECGCHVQTVIKAATRFGLIHGNHPRKTARRRRAHRIIREAYERAVAVAAANRVEAQAVVPSGPPEWPDCPAWLADILS
jgi:hypothetical protein